MSTYEYSDRILEPWNYVYYVPYCFCGFSLDLNSIETFSSFRTFSMKIQSKYVYLIVNVPTKQFTYIIFYRKKNQQLQVEPRISKEW